METLLLSGRVLILSRSPDVMRQQLSGTELTLSQVGVLADDVSTDEITPVPILTHYDDKLGRYPYTGFNASGERVITPSSVRDGGFAVTVGG